jgi:hypothetical protein
MYELMAWLESSAFAVFLRGLGVWTYGILNLGHILGISVLFGAVLVLDLRLLGLWRSIPARSLIKPTVPLAAGGFLLAAASGIMMLSFNTTEYHGNPFIYFKFPLIVFGLVNVALIQRLPALRRAKAGQAPEAGDPAVLRVWGALSLLTWMGVVASGRLIGYW